MTDMSDTVGQLVRKADAYLARASELATWIAVLVARQGEPVRISNADLNKVRGMAVTVDRLKSGVKITLVKDPNA
jgi:hypothetical protein